MDATNLQKVMDAGFTVIRPDDHPNIRIKFKDKDQREWKTLYGNFPTKAERDRKLTELLRGSRLTIQD